MRKARRLSLGSVRLVVALASFATWSAWRFIKRRLTPKNPELALRFGFDLVRGPQRVLAVTAHQDDLELFIGGTLRLLALAGSDIDVVVATGGNQQYSAVRTLDQIREQEERDAGTIIGYRTVRFLHFRDLELSRNPYFEDALRDVWRQTEPDVVFAFDPSAPYRSAIHPDHLAVGRAVLNVSRSLQGRTPAIVFYGSADPNVLVDVSQVMTDKCEAVRAHRSQLYGWKRFYVTAVRVQAKIAGRAVSVPFAEPLRRLELPLLGPEAQRENWSREEAGAGVLAGR